MKREPWRPARRAAERKRENTVDRQKSEIYMVKTRDRTRIYNERCCAKQNRVLRFLYSDKVDFIIGRDREREKKRERERESRWMDVTAAT